MASSPPGPPPPSPPAALAEQAARHPERPFLFWPEGLDWRWASFAEVAADVDRLRGGTPARLEETSAAPAAVVAALSEIAGSPPAGGSPAPGAAARGLPASDRAAERAATGPAETAAALGRALAGPTPLRPRREVVVVAPPFADEGAGAFFAWAVVAGAAIVVEPSPSALVATAAWARPTVFRGDAAQAAALAGEAEAAERAGFAAWWRRLRRLLGAEPPPPLPFHRLHTLLLAGPPPAEEDLRFWRQRGTRVLADPADADGGAE